MLQSKISLTQCTHQPYDPNIVIEIPSYKHYFRLINPRVLSAQTQSFDYRPFQPLPSYLTNQHPKYCPKIPRQPEVVYATNDTPLIRAMKYRYAHSPPCQFAILMDGEQLKNFTHNNYLLIRAYIYNDKGKIINPKPHDHLTFALSNQVPITMILDFVNYISAIQPSYWESGIELHKRTVQLSSHFPLNNNNPFQRYPTNQVDIPSRLSYQPQLPNFDKLVQRIEEEYTKSDTDDEYPDDNSTTTSLLPNQSYNDTLYDTKL